MFKGKLFLSTAFALSWAFSGAICLAQQPANPELEARIYLGGDILTMRGTTPEYVESLVVKDGTILIAGTLAESARLAGANSKRIDLKGKTLLPGFIDTHGHFVYFGKNLVDANLFDCADIAELVSRMKKQAERTLDERTLARIIAVVKQDGDGVVEEGLQAGHAVHGYLFNRTPLEEHFP
jgi:imidazolonepropionase-like amidohydrolase